MAQSASVLADLCEQFLAGLLAQLASTPGGKPPVQLVAHGQVAIDSCCSDSTRSNGSGGMVWVTFARYYPSSRPPVQDNTLQPPCNQMLMAELQFGVVRCVPSITDDGLGGINMPDPADIQTAAVSLMADATAMGCAALAFIQADPLDGEGLLSQIVPYGPEGGCGGSMGTLTINATAAGV